MPTPLLRADAPFQRLWLGFLSARVAIALALLALQGTGLALQPSSDPRLVALCSAYLAATLLTRLLASPLPPPAQVGARWLPLLGVDLLLVGLLEWLQVGNMNYTPLFGVPVLMAAVLGSLTLALGTTACATLMLLGSAWWHSLDSLSDTAGPYLQAALTGTGYFLVAYLSHQLAQRLLREQELAQQSQQSAQAQAQVNALVIENLSDGVLVLGADGWVQVANPAALQLLAGTQPLQPPFSLGSQTAWTPLQQLAHSTFVTGLPQRADIGLLHSGRSPTGLRVRTWLTAQQGLGAPGSHAMAAQCVMFLHDLRELEARLRTEKLASMGRMSAAVAHEIRNPLAAIVQANALLAEDLAEPGQQRLSQMVAQNAERLARIAEEVLDIARVQNQISHAPPASLALDTLVQQVWQDWRSPQPARRQALVQLQAGAVQVEFDAEHLRRVLINLLDNALRFMGPLPDSLQIHSQQSPDGQVSLQVWSDGGPLDPSVERHLFEPFFSSHSRNSGLGLYICRELCQRHGASLHYQRLARSTARGLVSGNAFSVLFRRHAPPPTASGLSDALVV